MHFYKKISYKSNKFLAKARSHRVELEKEKTEQSVQQFFENQIIVIVLRNLLAEIVLRQLKRLLHFPLALTNLPFVQGDDLDCSPDREEVHEKWTIDFLELFVVEPIRGDKPYFLELVVEDAFEGFEGCELEFFTFHFFEEVIDEKFFFLGEGDDGVVVVFEGGDFEEVFLFEDVFFGEVTGANDVFL